MKALLFEKHAPADSVLKLGSVPVPSLVPPGFVLVKVHAAALNPIDKMRVEGGLKALRAEDTWPAVVGYDVAGVVEKLGDDVNTFGVGDEIVARIQSGPMLPGTICEYCVVLADTMAKKPASISFTDAASFPLAGETALQALRLGGVGPGSKVFVSGGAGGVGTLAIQIAKILGAETVATTASPGEKTELCTSLGADVVVNYRDEKFEEKLQDYDFAFDTTQESAKMARIIKANAGKSVVTISDTPTVEALKAVGMTPNFVVRTALGMKRNKVAEAACKARGVEWKYMFLQPNGADLAEILQWAADGKLKAVIDDVWPLEQSVAAAQRNFSGRAKGKCVVQVFKSSSQAAVSTFAVAMSTVPATMKAVVNKRQGDKLVYGVAEVPTPVVSDDKDLIVKVEAAPVNPSDLATVSMLSRFNDGKVFAGDSPSTVAIPLPEAAHGIFKADGDTRPVGGEGSGIVVAAGASPEAQALIGKRVAIITGSTYAQYTKTSLNNPMFAVLPDGFTAVEGASVFVNPMTAIGFVHTMKEEGHKAIVHTAAASQLGRMLVKLCKEEGIPLVNIVRKEEQVEILRSMGAEYIVNSSAPTFKEDLLAAVNATKATLAFDATGGGTLAMDILETFEKSLRFLYPDQINPTYGPAGKRTVYKYGGLDKNDSDFLPSVGVGNWTWAGWLMPFHFAKFDPSHQKAGVVKAVAGLRTTFSSTFGTNLSLEEMAASPEQYMATLQSQTDKKFLVRPNGV